jgi:hypothetical protein
MKKTIIMSVLVVAFFGIAGLAAYADILVVSTKGEAAFLAGSQWKPLSKGQTIAEGTKVSTGVASSIILNIDGSIVTVKPMSSIKIYKNSKDDTTRETSLGLQYGSVRAKVNKVERVKTKFNITTAVATSSVRGTEELVSFGPGKGMSIRVIEGTIAAFNSQGVSNLITGRQTFNLLTDNSRSDSVLRDVKDLAVVDLAAHGGLTEETQSGQDNGAEIGNSISHSTAHVNLPISWPAN